MVPDHEGGNAFKFSWVYKQQNNKRSWVLSAIATFEGKKSMQSADFPPEEPLLSGHVQWTQAHSLLIWKRNSLEGKVWTEELWGWYAKQWIPWSGILGKTVYPTGTKSMRLGNSFRTINIPVTSFTTVSNIALPNVGENSSVQVVHVLILEPGNTLTYAIKGLCRWEQLKSLLVYRGGLTVIARSL